MAYKAFDLTGKVALVTGGNSGIGPGFALALAEAGADIAIWTTNADKNAAGVARLATTGRHVQAFVCDVGDDAAVDACFAQTLAAFGRVDACFANAGVGAGQNRSFMDMSAQEWQRVMRINLDGVFYTLRAASRHMVQRGGGGSLVATASLAAIMGAARAEHYGASKGAVVSMIRGLAVELARHGIRANAILPGWIETGMTARGIADPKFSDLGLQARAPPRAPAHGDLQQAA